MNITIVGTGYVGLVSGVCFSDMGHNVKCLDINPGVIKTLKKGEMPYYEPGIAKLIQKNIKKNKLKFTTSYKQAVKDTNIFFICVGTPENKDGSSNLAFVFDVAKQLSENITKNSIVITKSTVPVGTHKQIEKIIRKFKKSNIDISVASNPEFLREGNALIDFQKPDRIIVGVDKDQDKKVFNEIYRAQKNKLIFMSRDASELTKYAANSFLATKISFINELSLLSDHLGIDINDIKAGIGSDPRIGDKFLNAGLGFGGSCFPKDVSSLINSFKTNKIESNILSAVVKANVNQRKHFLKKILGPHSKKELLSKSFYVWGLSFKPDTDDIRESISIKLIKDLSSRVKHIYAYDPIANANAANELKDISNITITETKYSEMEKCDGLIVCTEWNEFKNPNIKELNKMRSKVVFDGRNSINKVKLAKNNIKYINIC
jgi:UDPglucose 6-dehydrogenase